MRKRRRFLRSFSNFINVLQSLLTPAKWFCFREKCIRNTFVLVLVILTATACVLHIIIPASVLICLNWKVDFAIRELCRNYDNGIIAGNLCEDLCHTGQVVTLSCYMPHLAKDIVFTARWKDNAIVIKSRHGNMAAYDPFPYSAISQNDNAHFEVEDDFWQIVNDIVLVNYDIDFKKYYLVEPAIFLQTVLTSDFDLVVPKKKYGKLYPSPVFQSVWLLVQQKEYLTFKLFENSSLFPRIYGSCGHFYAMERLTPLSDLLFVDWQFRVELASKVVKLLEAAERQFPHPLRICDMKMVHFGMDQTHQLKILDGDDVYFQNVLNNIVCYDDSKCWSDKDCSFFDCKMKCNFTSRTCDTRMVNNNLQAVCEKMLTESNFWQQLFQPNLIHSLPRKVAEPLAPVLNACAANTEMSNRTESFLTLKKIIKALSTKS